MTYLDEDEEDIRDEEHQISRIRNCVRIVLHHDNIPKQPNLWSIIKVKFFMSLLGRIFTPKKHKEYHGLKMIWIHEKNKQKFNHINRVDVPVTDLIDFSQNEHHTGDRYHEECNSICLQRSSERYGYSSNMSGNSSFSTTFTIDSE